MPDHKFASLSVAIAREAIRLAQLMRYQMQQRAYWDDAALDLKRRSVEPRCPIGLLRGGTL